MNIYFFIAPYRIYLLCVATLLPMAMQAQQSSNLDKCYFYQHTSLADAQSDQNLMKHLEGLHIKKGEQIADIGAGTLRWEGALSLFTEGVRFFAVDIDSACCNAQQASYVYKYYSIVKGERISNSFKTSIGTGKSTGLPTGSMNKVMIIQTFHEFSDPEAMLRDIFRIMKASARLYISELVPRDAKDRHPGCEHHMYNPAELKKLVLKHGFVLEAEIPIVKADKNNRAQLLYRFRKNTQENG